MLSKSENLTNTELIQATVLLVEDDESLQEGIRDLLEIAHIGYDIAVVTANDGRHGLEMLQTMTPNLIISDIMMPNMDGYQFLEAVRQSDAWLHVPFIFLTAKGKKQDIREGRLSGAELYITKPFNSTELLELVKTQLDRTFQLQNARQRHIDTFKRSILQLLNHEFRTPLTYVTAYYEMLDDSLSVYQDTENLGAYLHGIYAGCQRLAKLVEDLILVMEIRTGEAAAAYETQGGPIPNIGHKLHQIGQAKLKALEVDNVNISYNIPANLPALYGVESQLAVVFGHIIENAIKFIKTKESEDCGQVEIRAEVREDAFYLTVADNGVGIPSAAQELIFDLFYQHERELFEQQGSGSGLTIAKGIVEIHGGRIDVASVEGEGSRFTVMLPLKRNTAATPQKDSTTHPAHILIVEDDFYLLDGLRELLELYEGPYELTVATAEDGIKGLAALNKQQPDLIISDIMMPNMDGFEFLAEVRRNSEWLQIPFIFLTAKGERADILQGHKSGAEQYITKPYDSDELLDLITVQLDRYFQLRSITNQGFESLKHSILNLLQSDFRTPLNSVATYSELLSNDIENVTTADGLKDSLIGIKEGSERISELVEHFIDLAEIRTGEMQNAFKQRAIPMPNLGLVLQEAVSRRQFNQQMPMHIAVNTQGIGSLSPIMADYDTLLKGVERMLDVVLVAAEQNGARNITLEAEDAGDVGILSLRHNGQGLDSETANLIDTLFQKDSEKILETVNIGPNLAYAKGVVDVHKGRLRLESNRTLGDRYIIELPLYKKSSPTSTEGEWDQKGHDFSLVF